MSITMEHKGTMRIETSRLILREFSMDDVEAVFHNWESDDKVTEFLRWPTAQSISETESVLQEWVDNYADKSFYQWAIVPKDFGEPIGTISVVGMDEKTEKVHIGYCIGSKWWKKGYTSEAFLAIIPFFFQEVKVKRIESQHDPNNPNSGKVMKKCGLKYEGTMKKADWNNKGIVDACMYGLVAEDYFKEKKDRNVNDKIISALIGLVGTCDNNPKTKNTDHVIMKALAFPSLHSEVNEETLQALIEEIYAEKYAIAPGCAACQTPCGNTSDYDMNRIYSADADVCSLKLKILSAIEEAAADLYSHQKMDVLTEESMELFYNGLAYTGYDMEEGSLRIFWNEVQETIEEIRRKIQT